MIWQASWSEVFVDASNRAPGEYTSYHSDESIRAAFPKRTERLQL